MLDAMKIYWADHPPIHILLAAKWGFKSRVSSPIQAIEEAAEFVPVATCSDTEFNTLLAEFGLPAGPAA